MLKKIIKDELLIGSFISNLMYSLAYPSIHYALIKSVNENIISFNSIITCLGGIIAPSIWNKYSDKIFKKYKNLLILEILFYSILIASLLAGIVNNKFYYIADTLLFSLITKNIICGNNKIISIKYKDKEREEYDNNFSMLCNISSLIGYSCSFLFSLKSNVAFIAILLGISLDNIFYYVAYKKTNNIITINKDHTI